MHFEWIYKRLGDFTYNVLDQRQIKPFLMQWIMAEWQQDYIDYPDQPWTAEWIALLPKMTFVLEKVALDQIAPRSDLMADAEFIEKLRKRASEREESLLRGVSTEPLLLNRDSYELMDGYTRYIVMKKHGQTRVYAYVGTVERESNVRT